MSSYAWPPTMPGRIEYSSPNAPPERVNRIRYPKPNRLGLITPTPYSETVLGRTVESYK